MKDKTSFFGISFSASITLGMILSALFLMSAAFGNLYFSLTVFCLIAASAGLMNLRSLRLAGGLKFWVFPTVFIFALPFLGADGGQLYSAYSCARFRDSALMWMHFYVFNCLVNFFSDNFSVRDFMEFFEKRGMRGAGIRFSLALCAFRRIKYEADEIFCFYRMSRPGTLKFLSGISDLAYVFIRNSLKTAEQITELFFIRNIKI